MSSLSENYKDCQKAAAPERTIAAVCLKDVSQRLASFGGDRRGSLAVVFTLALTMSVAIVGGAVDYARYVSARVKVVHAMDSAVLSGAREILMGKDEATALLAAQAYYDKNKPSTLSNDSVTFSVNGGFEVIGVNASKIDTTLLRVAGIDELLINTTTSAKVQVGANAGQNVEIALMLDTTGSMAGSKMVALKQAAIDLINITIWSDQSEYTSRVAIVPFTEYVNPGRDAFEVATNYSPPGNSDNRTCVKERPDATNRYTDATPNSSNGYFNYYTGTSACRPQATILPLSSDKQAIEQRINEMQPTGATAGHLGTAWAWYTLSPNFSDLWPAESAPESYGMLQELNDRNQPRLRKIAVLMTDGEYNKKYSGDSSAVQARATCDGMKAAGVTIYTVGFAIASGGEAATTMEHCASSDEHSYSADDADALRSAFRDIALKIATLRLTQ